jgi:hypothetical protein
VFEQIVALRSKYVLHDFGRASKYVLRFGASDVSGGQGLALGWAVEAEPGAHVSKPKSCWLQG